MTCTAAGGQWNADTMKCTPAADVLADVLKAKQDMQRKAITGAISKAQTAVAAVDNDSTDAEVTAAETAIADARSAITAAADLSDEVKTAHTGTVNALASQLTDAKGDRKTAMDDKATAADKAMMAKAKKLYDGITVSVAGRAGYATGDDSDKIAIDTDGTTLACDTIGTECLTEDKKTTVAALHGWNGKKYALTVEADPGKGDMYEAVVYSNDMPTQGKKFGKDIAGDTAAEGYEYPLSNGSLSETTTEGTTSRIDISDYNQSAGVQTFDKGSNDIAAKIDGSYHGVSGTYSCAPGANTKCAVRPVANGFELGQVADSDGLFAAATEGGTWTFKPDNGETRVTDSADPAYASYGWWIKKSADGKTYTASAFSAHKSAAPDASIGGLVTGTATYTGGAAGHYALHSSTGGMNDAGNFTARATLNADFKDDKISGTLDNFIGDDGMSRNWSVKLNEAGLAANGNIPGSAGGVTINAENPHVGTVWTIGDNAAGKSGQWLGSLHDTATSKEDPSGVPKYGVGTFYTEHGNSGKMVGGFGVTKQ